MRENKAVVLTRHSEGSGSGNSQEYRLGIYDLRAIDNKNELYRFFGPMISLFMNQVSGKEFPNIRKVYDDRDIPDIASEFAERYEADLSNQTGDEMYGLCFSLDEEGAERVLREFFGKGERA